MMVELWCITCLGIATNMVVAFPQLPTTSEIRLSEHQFHVSMRGEVKPNTKPFSPLVYTSATMIPSVSMSLQARRTQS